MTADEEIHAAFWHAISLTVLCHAPIPLRRMFSEMGTVPAEQTLRELREFNDGIRNHLHVESTNGIYRSCSTWRH
jgi:hypothetical protein